MCSSWTRGRSPGPFCKRLEGHLSMPLRNTPGSFCDDPLAEKQAGNPGVETSEKQCQAYLKKKQTYCGKPVIPNQLVCAGHGGLSTGPRTAESREQLAASKTVHGQETRALRALRSKISHELLQLEEVLYAEGLIHGPRTRGRKPTSWRSITSEISEPLR